jgi:hypothetical protein
MTKLTVAFRNFVNAPKNGAWNANYMVSRTSKKKKRNSCVVLTVELLQRLLFIMRFAILKSEGGRT